MQKGEVPEKKNPNTILIQTRYSVVVKNSFHVKKKDVKKSTEMGNKLFTMMNQQVHQGLENEEFVLFENYRASATKASAYDKLVFDVEQIQKELKSSLIDYGSKSYDHNLMFQVPAGLDYNINGLLFLKMKDIVIRTDGDEITVDDGPLAENFLQSFIYDSKAKFDEPEGDNKYFLMTNAPDVYEEAKSDKFEFKFPKSNYSFDLNFEKKYYKFDMKKTLDEYLKAGELNRDRFFLSRPTEYDDNSTELDAMFDEKKERSDDVSIKSVKTNKFEIGFNKFKKMFNIFNDKSTMTTNKSGKSKADQTGMLSSMMTDDNEKSDDHLDTDKDGI